MSVTEAHMAHGSWTLGLEFPGSTWDTLLEFGHVIITDRSFVPAGKTDAQFLAASLYTGVVTKRSRSDKVWAISGSGMDFWLGDGSEFGEVLEPPKAIGVNYWEGETFTNVLTTLLPAALTVGTINITGITAAYYNEHIWDTPLIAIRYVIDAFAAIEDAEIEYRVNNDGTFDAGLKSNVYDTTPSAFIVRRKPSDVPGSLSHGRRRYRIGTDIRGYATRAVLQAQGAGYTLRVGAADLTDIGETNPYKDLQGNALTRVKVISEPETPQFTDDPANLPNSRAQLHLKEAVEINGRLNLTNTEWHIDDIGSFEVGDMIWVEDDTDSYWEDLGNPQSFDGGTVHPVQKRVFKKTWPIHKGKYKVFYRDKDAAYTELTSIMVDEDPQRMSVEIGSAAPRLAYNPDLLHNVVHSRSSNNPDTNDPTGTVNPGGEQTIPAVVLWANTPWGFSQWIDQSGKTKVAIEPQWTQPLNTDTSTIIDGAWYEIHYKRSDETSYRPSLIVPFDQTSIVVDSLETTPTGGWIWDFRIRAVDKKRNVGVWSAIESVATIDTTPPSKPAVATLSALPIFIQVTHDFQKDATGALELDTAVIRVHASISTGFTPSAANLVLTLGANKTGNDFLPVTNYFESTPFGGDGTTIFIKLVAVDQVGNASVESTENSVVSSVITTTEVTDLAITTPKLIANAVDASKLATIVMSVGKHIQSTVFTAGSAGWRILADGDAEFNNVIIRGTISGGSLTLGASGVFRTASSGVRVQMTNADNDFIEFFDATTNIGRIGYRATGEVGIHLETLVGSGEKLWLKADDDIQIIGTGGNLDVQIDSANAVMNLQAGTALANGRIDFRLGPTLVGGFDGEVATTGNFFQVPTGDAEQPGLVGLLQIDSGIYWVGDELTMSHNGVRGFGFFSNSTQARLMGRGDTSYLQYDSNLNQWKLIINNVVEFLLGTTGFLVTNVYNSNFGGGSTVLVDSDGRLHRNTSGLKTKTKITDASDLADIELAPIRYRKKGVPTATFQYGLVADYLIEQNSELGQLDEDGDPDDFFDRGVLAVLSAKSNRADTERATLADRITQLEEAV